MGEPRFLIIGGAEKAGTTSLYTYLAAHPEVLPSIRKETDYFRAEGASLEGYLQQFAPPHASRWLRMESSPGYLAESEFVAPRLAAAIPQARLVFLLRDPIDRLRSSYRFYRSRLHVPDSMSFECFVRACMAYEESGVPPKECSLKLWHLRALERGRYEKQLAPFRQYLPEAQILLLNYEALRRNARALAQAVAEFADIGTEFYESYEFTRENVSFLAKHQLLQRIALLVNNQLETVWRQHPKAKRRLMDLYKRMNEAPLNADPLVPETERRLREWYAPTFSLLAGLRMIASEHQERSA